jgi:DNA-binding beta-propeller fold protein YncE
MIALVYVIAMVLVGDAFTRRWARPTSVAHRLATAFLVGLLLSTWTTFLLALVWAQSDQPLAPANALFLAVAAVFVVGDRVLDRRRAQRALLRPRAALRRAGRALWDERGQWLFVLVVGTFVTWMAFTTFSYDGTGLRVGIHEYGDFGPNTAISAGFAIGHNLPPEYPLFAGPRILYHFLFYFQAGNLTYLGWDPAVAGNVLYVGSMVSLLVVLVALGARVFGTRVVGYLGAVLFFAHGSLSFVPYLASFPSIAAAVEAIPKSDTYLSSGFPYHAEDYAIWTQNVFLNQRHLASAIGILLVVLLFVTDRAARTFAATKPALPSASSVSIRQVVLGAWRQPGFGAYLAAGLLLGLLPLWNSAVYLAGAVLMAGILVLFPNRIRMLALGAVAVAVSLPQILYLRPDGVASAQFPAFHWGYTVAEPTLANVAIYVAFMFGPKIALMALAVIRGTPLQRRLFVAIAGPAILAFTFQLSIDLANNHKLLTIWLILGNLFAAAGLVQLWQAVTGWRGRSWRVLSRLPGRAAAVGLAGVIAVGGLIDLVPIANDQPLHLPMRGDRLYDWVVGETDRRSVFLSDLYVHHSILRAGRKVYLGWPAYPFSMGYAMGPREESYRRLLSSASARDVVRELQETGIDYVAFDDGLREGSYVGGHNEALYAEHLPTVFDDPGNQYGHLKIYEVPTDPDAWRTMPGASPVDSFKGGLGADAGQFSAPRGLAVGPDGSIVVADTGNNRVQWFAPDGTYEGAFGSAGEGPGQFSEPNGVAVDLDGRIYVADLADRVQVVDGDRVAEEWRGTDSAFYGPRDVAIGDDGSVYVLDQGHGRVVRRAADGSISTFGSLGSGEGQLLDPTGIGTGAGLVAVADPLNSRIVVFSDSGASVRSIPVEEWGAPFQYPDVAIAPAHDAIYASSPDTGEILVFSLDGERRGALRDAITHPGPLDQPSSLVVRPDGAILVIELGANRIAVIRP